MLTTPHLTESHDAVMTGYIKNSHAGMAHWAGSGPEGKYCSDCQFMKKATKKSAKGICTEFKRMSGTKGKRFPVTARACRFYEVNT